MSRRIADLSKRIKELNCLYSISTLIEEKDDSVEDILKGIINLIPIGWQYPEITCVRLIIDGHTYTTKNWKETSWKQERVITLQGTEIGALEICYLEERPASDDGPFLEEETSLIKAICERLGRVAARNKSVEALRESEDRYRALFDRSLELVYLHDFEGNIIDANPAALEALGYSRKEIGSVNLFQLIDKEQLPGVLKKTEKLRERGVQRGTTEYRVRCKDGNFVDLETKASMIFHDDKPFAVQVIARDITERKKAEEELRLKELILDKAFDSIILRDLEGKIIYANEVAYKARGYTREELLDTDVRKLLPPGQEREFTRRVQEVLKKGSTSFEFTYVRKDGSLVPAELNMNTIEINGKTFVLSIVRDISERKKAEQELQLKEQMIDRAADTIILRDLDGKMIYANEVAYTSRGYTREEFYKLSPSELSTPEAAKLIQPMREEALKKGVALYETTHVRKDGSLLPVEIELQTMEFEGRTMTLTMIQDITERKQAEEEKKQLEQTAQVANRLASLGEMAAGIAHEINNPLTAIIGFAELLMRKEVDTDIREWLEIIHENANRVAGIVRKLLALARSQQPRREMVDINNTITTILKLREYELMANNIKLTTKFDSKLPLTLADQSQLQHVFLNLVLNAETEMRLAHGKGNLTIQTKQVKDFIRVSFKDDGPGIAEENMDKIFDPFFTTREVGQGTGLGLSICHGIVSEHKGKIYAISKPGHGATFIVELPILADTLGLTFSGTQYSLFKEGGMMKTLVIDDEPAVLKYLKQVLSEDGHEVYTVDNADDALQMIKKAQFNLILLDIKMPGMSGMKLYESLKKVAKPLVKKVLFITGDTIGPDTNDFLSRTRAPYITKPFNYEDLDKAIKDILSR